MSDPFQQISNELLLAIFDSIKSCILFEEDFRSSIQQCRLVCSRWRTMADSCFFRSVTLKQITTHNPFNTLLQSDPRGLGKVRVLRLSGVRLEDIDPLCLYKTIPNVDCVVVDDSSSPWKEFLRIFTPDLWKLKDFDTSGRPITVSTYFKIIVSHQQSLERFHTSVIDPFLYIPGTQLESLIPDTCCFNNLISLSLTLKADSAKECDRLFDMCPVLNVFYIVIAPNSDCFSKYMPSTQIKRHMKRITVFSSDFKTAHMFQYFAAKFTNVKHLFLRTTKGHRIGHLSAPIGACLQSALEASQLDVSCDIDAYALHQDLTLLCTTLSSYEQPKSLYIGFEECHEIDLFTGLNYPSNPTAASNAKSSRVRIHKDRDRSLHIHVTYTPYYVAYIRLLESIGGYLQSLDLEIPSFDSGTDSSISKQTVSTIKNNDDLRFILTHCKALRKLRYSTPNFVNSLPENAKYPPHKHLEKLSITCDYIPHHVLTQLSHCTASSLREFCLTTRDISLANMHYAFSVIMPKSKLDHLQIYNSSCNTVRCAVIDTKPYGHRYLKRSQGQVFQMDEASFTEMRHPSKKMFSIQCFSVRKLTLQAFGVFYCDNYVIE